MNNNIIPFALEAQNGKAWDVKQMLQNAITEIEIGHRKARSALILFLDDSDWQYNIGFSQSGMSSSQCIALLEIAKSEFLRSMGY